MTLVQMLSLALVVPGDNDRTRFDDNSLRDLAESIRAHGLAQPITVRPLDDTDLFQIVAGERRYRAVQLLSWSEIPALIRDLSAEEASAIMLTENVARADLDPIDESRAYEKRMTAFAWSVDDCARQAGVSPVRVRFRLKLLALRSDLQDLVRSGNLQLGYAQILADASLDTNRQSLAVAELRDNPNPTPGWFRGVAHRLGEEQAQESLFDVSLLVGPVAHGAAPIVEPPHPATAQPPRIGRNLKEILRNQIDYWNQAAEAWARLGRPFKRQECQAAAQALALALS